MPTLQYSPRCVYSPVFAPFFKAALLTLCIAVCGYLFFAVSRHRWRQWYESALTIFFSFNYVGTLSFLQIIHFQLQWYNFMWYDKTNVLSAFLARDTFVRTNCHAIGMIVCLSVCDGRALHCDHTGRGQEEREGEGRKRDGMFSRLFWSPRM